MSSLGIIVVLHVLLLNVAFTSATCPNGQFLGHSGVCTNCSSCRNPHEVVIKPCHARNDTVCELRADLLIKKKKLPLPSVNTLPKEHVSDQKENAVPFESHRSYKFMLRGPSNKSSKNNDAVKIRKNKLRKNESLIDKDGLIELSNSKISLDKNGKHIKKDLSSIDEIVVKANHSFIQYFVKPNDSKISSKKNKLKQKKNRDGDHLENNDGQSLHQPFITDYGRIRQFSFPDEDGQFVAPTKKEKKTQKKTAVPELLFPKDSVGMKKTIATVLEAASHLKNRTKFSEPFGDEYEEWRKNFIDDDDFEEDDDSKNFNDDEDDDEDDDDDDDEDNDEEDNDEDEDEESDEDGPIEVKKAFGYEDLVHSYIREKPKLKFKPFGIDIDQDRLPVIVDSAGDIDPVLVTPENKWPLANEVNVEPFVDTSNWQLLILVSAVSACLLFFIVVNAYLCIYMKKWRHMKQDFEAGVEDLSVRVNLMQYAGFEADESNNIKNYLTQLKGGKCVEK